MKVSIIINTVVDLWDEGMLFWFVFVRFCWRSEISTRWWYSLLAPRGTVLLKLELKLGKISS
jgi:hypothetical protein